MEFTSVDKVERTVTITGTPGELKQLAGDLRKWTPTGGWPREIEYFFEALEEED